MPDKEARMKLICSDGHVIDTLDVLHKGTQPGERCKMEMSYDRMLERPTEYCGKVMRPLCEGCNKPIKRFKGLGYRYYRSGRKAICRGCVAKLRLAKLKVAKSRLKRGH
jgi:hypothetical protein